MAVEERSYIYFLYRQIVFLLTKMKYMLLRSLSIFLIIVTLGLPAQASFTDNGRIIRGILDNTVFSEPDVQLMEEFAQADSGFKNALLSIKAGRPVSFREASQAYDALVRLIHLENNDNSDEYRFALYSATLLHRELLEYAEFFSYYAKLKTNVSFYVKDNDCRRQWHLLMDWLYPDELRIYGDDQGRINTLFCIYDYLLSTTIDSELKCTLGTALVQCASIYQMSIPEIDRIYDDVKKVTEKLYPGHKQYINALMTGYYGIQILNNPTSWFSLCRLKELKNCYPDDSVQKWSYMVTLSNVCRYIDRQEDSAEAREEAYEIMEKLCHSPSLRNDHGVSILQYQSKLDRALSSFFAADTVLFRNGFRELLADIDTIQNPVFRGRVLRSIYSSFPAHDILDINLNDKLLAQYIASAKNDPCKEVAALSFCSLSLKNLGIINPQKAQAVVTEALTLLEGTELEEMLTAAIESALGEYYCSVTMIDKTDDAEVLFRKALSYYVQEEDYNRMCTIFYLLSNAYYKSGNFAKAKEYAQAYWDIRPRAEGEQYKTDIDYLTQMILISSIDTPQRKLEALLRLKSLSENKGFIPVMGMIYEKIADVYRFELKDNKQARDSYEAAFPIMTEQYFYTKDLSFFVNFLSFLIESNDMARHNEVSAALVDILEMAGENNSIGYCQLLAYESDLAIRNHNPAAMVYYMAKLSSVAEGVSHRLDDEYETAMFLSIVVPAILHSITFYKNNVSEDVFDSIIKWDVEALVNDAISRYSKFSSSDYSYINLLLAKESYLVATKKYDEAAAVLDAVETNPFFAGVKNRDFIIPDYRLNLNMRTENYAEVERLLSLPEYQDVVATSTGDININRVDYVLNNLFTVYIKNKDYPHAYEVEKKRFELNRSFVTHQFHMLDEDTRLGLSRMGVLSAQNINTLLCIDPTPGNASLAYDAALFYRNLLLESYDMQRRAIMNSNDSILIADYGRLVSQRKQLSDMGYSADRQKEWSNLMARTRELEADIASRCEGFNTMEFKRKADWHKVERKLNGTDAAIEFISLYDAKNSVWRYGALLLKRGFKAPQFIELLTHSELSTVLQMITKASKQETGVNQAYNYTSSGKKLYEGLWQPLLPYLENVTDIYMATEGQLSTVAFPAIEDSTRTALCERYNLHMLSTTANVIDRDFKCRGGKRRMAIIGGVNYDADPNKAAVRSEWHYLPQSVNEINYVDSICASLPEVTAIRLDGDRASETMIRSFSGNSPELLLMSTHGFYVPADKAARKDYFLNKGLSSDSIPNTNIPSMFRGGLVLADGNKVWNNEGVVEDDADGILTGWEFSTLDFSNTQLAVLSACETGLGEVSDSEGIDGLQRGLKLAGVKTLVVSLWLVNDSAGMLFMKRFHDRMLRDGEECHEAFRNTQREMKQKYPRKPYMWAPFIMLD